jgi:hypothetical protein
LFEHSRETIAMRRQAVPSIPVSVGRRLAALVIAASVLGEAAAASSDPAKHWAYQPIRTPSVPRVEPGRWAVNPIDAFIAIGHRRKGLSPAPEASRRVLIRRLSLDLLGLPPTPAEVEAFLADRSPDAYEKLVDRLLASPHYGERWGRHWLDLARWAESEGYESNHPRPHAWRYRDYVVRSLNEYKPYPQFVREQLAGDEVRPYSDENLIATGFLAASRLSSNEEDKDRQRNDVLVDIVNATGSVFLGLTLHCAQCHSHKFDAITLRDYYRFQGFFVKGQPGNLALKDPALVAEYEVARPPEYEPTRRLQEVLYERARQRLVTQARDSLSPTLRAALAVPEERRTPEQEALAHEAELKFQFTPNQIEKAIREEDRPLYTELKKKLEALEKTMPDRPQTFGYYAPSTASAPVDVLPLKGFYPLPYEPAQLTRARARLLPGGDTRRRGAALEAGWPDLFGPTPREAIEKAPRLALADWLTSPSHPLSARVWVNRLWQYHFGRGLVATPSDFGVKGSPPSHPELLDWLASELLRTGGRAKHLHRLIVCSRTYRQSSSTEESYVRLDPENAFLARWSPRRLEAEGIRDAMLAVSGELDRTVGGPSDPDEGKSVRRTLYLLQKREAPPPVQGLLDGPSAAAESCPRRIVSTVPLQALYLLNNETAAGRSRAFARRVLACAGPTPERQVETAFALALGRAPDSAERQAARDFFRTHDGDTAGTADPPTALVHFCQALLNVNEFVYLE